MAEAISGSGQDQAVSQLTQPCGRLAFFLSPSAGRTTCTHCLGMALRGLKETSEQVRIFLLFISSLHTNQGLQHTGSTDLMYWD